MHCQSLVTAAHDTLPVMDFEANADVPKAPPGQDQLPSSDGVPLETYRHWVQMSLLIDSLRDHWSERRDVFVGGNMFVYFSELQTRGEHFRGPDVFVVLGTEHRPRKSWVAWEEQGKLPDVVVELLSESTRHIDRGEKMRIYSQIWKTSAYILYDPFSHELEGYRLDPARRSFERLVQDPNGDLPVETLGLRIGLRPPPIDEQPGPFLRWIKADGALIPSSRERAKLEKVRADAEQARADAEQARADAEWARAQAAEQQLAELRRQLARKDPG